MCARLPERAVQERFAKARAHVHALRRVGARLNATGKAVLRSPTGLLPPRRTSGQLAPCNPIDSDGLTPDTSHRWRLTIHVQFDQSIYCRTFTMCCSGSMAKQTQQTQFVGRMTPGRLDSMPAGCFMESTIVTLPGDAGSL